MTAVDGRLAIEFLMLMIPFWPLSPETFDLSIPTVTGCRRSDGTRHNGLYYILISAFYDNPAE